MAEVLKRFHIIRKHEGSLSILASFAKYEDAKKEALRITKQYEYSMYIAETFEILEVKKNITIEQRIFNGRLGQ